MNVWQAITRAGTVLSVLLAFAIFLVAGFLPKMERAKHLKARIGEKNTEIARLEQRLERLKRNQKELVDNPAFLERTAREELGYAFTNETVFRVEDPD